MHRIPLRRRDGTIAAHALIDDEDAHLAEKKWYLHHSGYVRRSYYPNGKKGGTHVESLHRVIMGLQPGDRRKVDHKNHDPLDNRRENLRLCTHAENHQNRRRSGDSNTSSEFRGVSWRKDIEKWAAYCVLNGRQKHLGYYDDELEAAKVAALFRREHMPFSEEAA